MKTAHFVCTQQEPSLDNKDLDKSNYERRAKWAELYEVQRTSELFEQRSWFDFSRLFSPASIREVHWLYKQSVHLQR